MNALDLIKTQMALECIGLNVAGELTRVSGPNPDTIPRVYVVHYNQGYHAYLRHDLPEDAHRKLQALSAEVAFHDQEAVQAACRAGYQDLPRHRGLGFQ